MLSTFQDRSRPSSLPQELSVTQPATMSIEHRHTSDEDYAYNTQTQVMVPAMAEYTSDFSGNGTSFLANFTDDGYDHFPFDPASFPPSLFKPLSMTSPTQRGYPQIQVDTSAVHFMPQQQSQNPSPVHAPQWPQQNGFSPGPFVSSLQSPNYSPSPVSYNQHPNFSFPPFFASQMHHALASNDPLASPGFSNSSQFSPQHSLMSIPPTPMSTSINVVTIAEDGQFISPSSQIVPELPDDNSNKQDLGAVMDGRRMYTHKEQVTLWKSVPSLLTGNFGPLIPQIIYKPHTNSDRLRYVENVATEAPIYFWQSHPDECGIAAIDAMHAKTKRLVNRDDPVFAGRGPSVSVRIEWPGYRPWSRQIPTKDFKTPPRPITYSKLAKNIAKCLQRFILDKQKEPMEDDSDPRWKVGGSRGIKFDDLIIVSVHHVSMGSWQPQVRLRRALSN